MKQGGMDPRDAVEAGEQQALEMLVEFFDWLDSLEPQATTEKLVPPPRISAWMDQVTPKTPKNAQVTPKNAQNSAMFALLAGSRVLSAVGMGCESEARIQPQSGTEWVGLLRKAEGKVQEGVWRVRKIFVDE